MEYFFTNSIAIRNVFVSYGDYVTCSHVRKNEIKLFKASS